MLGIVTFSKIQKKMCTNGLLSGIEFLKSLEKISKGTPQKARDRKRWKSKSSSSNKSFYQNYSNSRSTDDSKNVAKGSGSH